MAVTPQLRTITTFTVDGVDFRPNLLMGIEYESYGSGRTIAKCTVVDELTTLAVPDLAEVVIAIDGTTIFSGVVWDITLQRYGDANGVKHWTLNCVDWAFGLDTTLINGIYPGGSLESLLTTIIANMIFFGVTLDPSQDTGPTLPDQAWEFLTLRQAIDRVIGTWIWRIAPATKYFRAYEPYTLMAPRDFDETDVDGSGLFDVNITKNFNRYFNSGYIKYGPSGPAYVTEVITGNGTDSTFTLDHTYLQMNATGTLIHTISGTPATQTVSEDGTAQFTLSRSANTLTRNAGPVANGDTVAFEFLAQYPLYYQFIDSAGVLANGTFSKVVTDEGILTEAEAATLGDKILDRDGGPYRTVTFKTHFGIDLTPLMAVTLNLPSLGIVSTDEFLISEIHMREIAMRDNHGALTHGSYFEWEVICQEGLTIYDWLDEFRDDPLPAATAGAAGPPTTDPTSLFPTVQNRTKGHNTSDTTSHSISLPTGIQAGELLLVIFTTDEAPTVTINTGVSGGSWTLLASVPQSANVTGVILHKIAAGGGTDVLTLTTSTAQQSSHISYRISGTTTTSPVSAQWITDNSSNPNPPALTPATGQRSYLWIACRCGDSSANVATVAPSGYINFYQEVGTVNGASTAVAERSLNASTEDPGAWTSGIAFSVVFTLAVKPPI